MNDSDRRRAADPPERGPSTPPDLSFNPLAAAIGVFTAISIPIVVVGLTRTGGPDGVIIGVGIVLGLLAGVLCGIGLARRGGRVWRGPRI